MKFFSTRNTGVCNAPQFPQFLNTTPFVDGENFDQMLGELEKHV